jgi:MscS family membrane protein
MNNYEWLHYEILENPVYRILRFAIILFLGLLLKRFVSHHLSGLIFRLVQKRNSEVSIQEFRDLLHKPVALFILLLTLDFSLLQLQYPPSWELAGEEEFGLRMVVWKLFKISIFVSITWMLLRFADYIGMVLLRRAKKTPDRSDYQLVSFFKEAIKVVIVILSTFFILGAVFEINVAGLIAGLGIGGIAIALAAKDTLENLLGSFMIFLDKPFIVGDVIKIGNFTGTVERIGFRSSQIRTPERTIVTIPNRKLVDSELENISQRGTIRALFYLTLNYKTSANEIEMFLQNVRDTLNNNPNIEKDSIVRFERFNDMGCEVSVTFYALTDKFDKFTRIKEDILLTMLKLAAGQGLTFFPKQVV